MNAVRLNLSFVAATILTQLLLSACGAQAGSAHDSKVRPPAFTEFGNPEMVQILGYDDNDGNSNDAMEPFISRDGNYLFFNSSNAAPTTSLFWATRIDDVTFQYQGEIGGLVNSSGPLDAVASMDSDGIFYFITTRSYGTAGMPGYLSTIYSGPFADGAVTAVNPVPGVAAPKLGLVNFDEEISADGNTLYFTQGNYATGNLTSTEMMIATRHGDNFVVDPKSAKLMQTINDKHLNYAADTSADELEFFFTRTNLKVGPAIYMATRKSTSKPFGEPKKIDAITGFAEAPSISPDGLSLYYHVKNPSGVFVINRVTRSMKP
jgi:WD40-like Beta Propeller Repeat